MGVVSTNLAPCIVGEGQTAFEFGLISLYDVPQQPVCQMVELETVRVPFAGQCHLGVRNLFIEPGSPWENGFVDAFNARIQDELLDREIFYTI